MEGEKDGGGGMVLSTVRDFLESNWSTPSSFYDQFLDSDSDSRSASMDTEPPGFIDFFARESYSIGEEIESGLSIGIGIGTGSGGVIGNVETDSGRVEAVVGEEAMMTDDDIFEVLTANNYAEDDDGVALGMFDVGVGDNFVEEFMALVELVVESEYPWEDHAMFGNEEAGISGRPPASKRVVDDLPAVAITPEELSSSSDGSIVCAICKDETVVEEQVTRLPCRHYYHRECIVHWLGLRNTCPVCRYELPTDDLEYEKKRRSSQR